MKQRCLSLMLIVVVVRLCATVEPASAQSAPSPDASQRGVLLTKLSEPTYPRLAQLARIAGDVDLILTIRRDGTVQSAVIVSGHPMLRQAALDSAKQTQFECEGCGEGVTSYELKYKFQITPRDPPKDYETPIEKQPPTDVDLSRHQVTVSAWEIWTCDPVVVVHGFKARSARCLYLWRCGIRHED